VRIWVGCSESRGLSGFYGNHVTKKDDSKSTKTILIEKDII